MTLRIALDDPGASILRPRLRVDVEIITSRSDNTLSLLNGPAIGESGRYDVYRIVDGQAFRTSVELGFAGRQRVQVLAGLEEGDEVIISELRDYQHLDGFLIK